VTENDNEVIAKFDPPTVMMIIDHLMMLLPAKTSDC